MCCFNLDAIYTDDDHINFLVGVDPKFYPSKVMRLQKCITAKKSLKKYHEIKKQILSYELLNDRDYFGTTDDGQLPVAQKYSHHFE